ncbi:LamG domain-containing protein [Microbacterium sp. 1.5R]|uniref:LamG domain-containing protein n=1 Tax=Microbacterium sp. 1.5R TaxID=1916917 RepID=UPI0011A52842|nr:LamG domain-containing protein [Microbacterium sp. 1.5R]
MRAPRWRAAASILTFVGSLCALALTMSLLAPLGASAFWTATTAPGGAGAAGTTTLGAGNTPAVTTQNRNSVVVSWESTNMSNGLAATGYTVSRVDSANVQQTVLTGCSGVVTALTCTETGVPDGLWKYTITPRYQNWTGTPSSASAAVRTDTTAPVNDISLVSSTNASKTGNVVYYRGTVAGSFRLSNALTDAGGSGPASSNTGGLVGTSTGWSHTPSSVATPAGGPFVSNVFTWTANTTAEPTLGVAGIDAYGNTAPITLTMRLDTTAPEGGAISYQGGGTNAQVVDITLAAITDAGSGTANGTRILERRTAPLSGTTCGTFSNWATLVGGLPAQSTSARVALTANQCSQYRNTFTDSVGNSATVTSPNIVKAKSYRTTITSTQGLVNYYRLGDTGTTTVDSFGSGTGTQVGTTTGPGAIAGDSSLAKSYDGTRDYNAVSRTIGASFTIEFWFKSSQNFGPSGGQWYQGAGLVDGEVSGVANDFGVSLVAGRVVAGTGNPDRSISSTAAYNDDQWHHVVLTREQNNVITLYVDGVSQGTIATNAEALTAPTSLNFGRLQTGINYYRGFLDEVSLYNRVLTPAEVTAHFGAGNAN